MSLLGIPVPIIGPPTINIISSFEKPPISLITSLALVPVLTNTFTGFFKPSPVKVTILSIKGLFIFIGHSPNTQLFEGQLALEPDGTIKINRHMETSKRSVFAAGEIADPHFRQVITSAGMGAAAAISATHCLETMSCGL